MLEKTLIILFVVLVLLAAIGPASIDLYRRIADRKE